MRVRIDWDDGTTELCDLTKVKGKVEEAITRESVNGAGHPVSALMIIEVDDRGEEVLPNGSEFGVEWTVKIVEL